MQRKIKFGSTEILVQNAYPHNLTPGDRRPMVVMEISAREEDTDEETLKLLKDNTGPIEYYETVDTQDEEGNVIEGTEFVLKHIYEGYDSGEYVSKYRNGVYEVQVTRLGEIERLVRQTAADVAYLGIMSGVNL